MSWHLICTYWSTMKLSTMDSHWDIWWRNFGTVCIFPWNLKKRVYWGSWSCLSPSCFPKLDLYAIIFVGWALGVLLMVTVSHDTVIVEMLGCFGSWRKFWCRWINIAWINIVWVNSTVDGGGCIILSLM